MKKSRRLSRILSCCGLVCKGRRDLTVIYRVNPDLFTPDLLPRLPDLSDGGWRAIVQLRTEAVVRRLLARYRWRELKESAIQADLETQFTEALAERVTIVGLEVMAVNLLKTELDGRLQQRSSEPNRTVLKPVAGPRC